jgi:hypothetical protein
MKQPFGPAGDNDARGAYLFLCPRTNCYGITLEKSGANLHDQGCDAGWQFQAEFPLGIREAIPAPMDPEPVIRGIKADGYFVWREGPVRNPSGTAQ